MDRRNRARWGSSGLLTKPFTSLERRQQRFLSTLFKEAEKLGYKVKGEAPYEVSLETGRNAVNFKLRERIKQVRRRLTDEEKAERMFSSREWRQDRIATGELVFSLETWIASGLRREWRDGQQPLEDQIAEIIAVLAVAGPILEATRLKAEAAEHRRWEEEKRRREEKERQDQDRNRWRRLVEYAEAWREAQLVGDFIEALTVSPGDPQAQYDEKSIVDWMAWARERRGANDPLRWNVGDLWADIASITAWNYRDHH